MHARVRECPLKDRPLLARNERRVASCKSPAAGRAWSLGRCLLQELIVGERSQLLRHDHAPGIEDELAELVLVDGFKANDQPLVAHVRWLRAQKLVRVGSSAASRSSFGKAKPISVSSREKAR